MEPAIRIEHLTKIFPSGGDVAALRDVSLDIAPGDIFGIIGYSGGFVAFSFFYPKIRDNLFYYGLCP